MNKIKELGYISNFLRSYAYQAVFNTFCEITIK